ncbi:MAG: hypothetical protein ACFFG0_03460 [Candidatus Thorarchaeota archaeon]
MILGLVIIILIEIYIRYTVYKLKKDSIFDDGFYYLKHKNKNKLGRTILGNIFIYPNIKKEILQKVKLHELCHKQEQHYEIMKFFIYSLIVVICMNLSFKIVAILICLFLINLLGERFEDRANAMADC